MVDTIEFAGLCSMYGWTQREVLDSKNNVVYWALTHKQHRELLQIFPSDLEEMQWSEVVAILKSGEGPRR